MYWARELVGSARRAVEVTYGGATTYLDDEPHEPTEEMREFCREHGVDPDGIQRGYFGWAWDKVTKGRGSPRYAHRDLEVAGVVEYLTDTGLPVAEAEELAAEARELAG